MELKTVMITDTFFLTMTASGTVETHEEATVGIKERDMYIVQVKTLAFSIYPSVVRSLLSVSRTDILESCWCSVIALRIATTVLEKESCCVSRPHSRTAHLTHSVVLWLQKI